LFGHIHSFGQQTQILNETVFINCCCFTAIWTKTFFFKINIHFKTLTP
jgi:hypothetical protein